MRYLGLDLGSKTLGVALSDSTGQIASPYEVIRFTTYEEALGKLSEIIDEFDIKEMVIGNPLNMKGTESKRTFESMNFKSLIEDKFDVKVFLQDERLSTVEAEKLLIRNNTTRKNRKKVIDKLAATIILQTFLDKKERNK